MKMHEKDQNATCTISRGPALLFSGNSFTAMASVNIYILIAHTSIYPEFEG